MILDGNTAVIDNDFTGHLAEAHLTDEILAERLNTIFSELGLSIVMHPLVYEHELLKDAPRIAMLFDRNILNKAEFVDIHQNDPGKKAYYTFFDDKPLSRSKGGKTFHYRERRYLLDGRKGLV